LRDAYKQSSRRNENRFIKLLMSLQDVFQGSFVDDDRLKTAKSEQWFTK